MQATFTLNGQTHKADAPDETLLSEYLRDHLGLTGTHIGCDTSQCGACNVLVGGETAKACTLFVGTLDGQDILTIEGLSQGDNLHPMQAAFREAHGLQCGFCTPGMVLTGIAIAKRHGPDVDAETIRADLEGNFCRCTGYHHIVDAIQLGAKTMAKVA